MSHLFSWVEEESSFNIYVANLHYMTEFDVKRLSLEDKPKLWQKGFVLYVFIGCRQIQ
jgi:hypothetical protein